MGKRHRQKRAIDFRKRRLHLAIGGNDFGRRFGGVIDDRQSQRSVCGDNRKRCPMGARHHGIDRKYPVQFGQGLAQDRHHGLGIDVAVGRPLDVAAGGFALGHGLPLGRE